MATFPPTKQLTNKRSSLIDTSNKLTPGLSLKHSTTCEEKLMPENSWTHTDATTFQVRIGPDYKTNRLKEASGTALYECVAVDMYQSEKKIGHVSRLIDLNSILHKISDEQLLDDYLPPIFVVNFQIPAYPVENAIWGKNKEEGPGYSLVCYYVYSQEVQQIMKERRERIARNRFNNNNNNSNNNNNNTSSNTNSHTINRNNNSSPINHVIENPEANDCGENNSNSRWLNDDDADVPNSIRLLHRFTARETDPDLRLRFKCISRIVNLESAGIGNPAKKLIQTYNGTPFLIRTTSTFHYGQSYFEVDVDVHRFSYLARLGLSGVRERIKDVIFDLAFVVEGHTDDELPEQILSSQRLSKLDLSTAKTFPEKYLQEEKQ